MVNNLSLSSLYLFGIIRFPHDEKEKIGSSRITFGLLTLFFVIYLLPGISCKYQDVFHTLFGLPPPKTYSYCKDPSEVINLSNERIVTKDYFEAIELSKNIKPILVDFTGMACVNCRKLENQIWNDAEVDNLISQYVLAQLYVDIRKEVPEHKIDEC